MCGVGCPVASAWQYQHGSVIAVAGQRKCGIVSVQAAEAGTPHLRYGAAGETGGLPEGPPPPPGPQGRRRCHPSPHCATARLGRPVAYPKGRPNPAGPQGRRRRHPSSSCATVSATARRGRRRGPAYPKGRPYCQKRDPAPPEIGRGSKRALTHRAGKSNRPSRRTGRRESPRAPAIREPPALKGDHGPSSPGRSTASGPEALQSPPLYVKTAPMEDHFNYRRIDASHLYTCNIGYHA